MSSEFPGLTVGFQLASSGVFTFATLRHVTFLPGRTKSFVKMLLLCS